MHSLATDLKQWIKRVSSPQTAVILLTILLPALVGSAPEYSIGEGTTDIDFDIDIYPWAPTTEDYIRIELSGIWPHTCTPRYSFHSVTGNQIEIWGQITIRNSLNTPCFNRPTPWSFTVNIGQLEEGWYIVYGRIIDFDANIHEQTKRFEVTGPSCEIWGKVCEDTDQDGSCEPGEQRLSFVTVRLLDEDEEEVDTYRTGYNGLYEFTVTEVESGDVYYVVETDPEGYTSVNPNRIRVTVEPGERIEAGDFCDYPEEELVTSTPTPTRTPTIIQTRTSTSTPTRTPTPTPTLSPNSPALQDKDELIRYLENPGFLVLGLEVPDLFREYIPDWGYNENAMKQWINRFRQSGYSETELRLLRRAILAEKAEKEYYEQALRLSDKSAYAVGKLLTAADLMLRVIRNIEKAAQKIPLGGRLAGKAAESARKIANDLLNDIANLWVDTLVTNSLLNENVKLFIASAIDAISRVGPTELFDEVVEQGTRAIGNYALMKCCYVPKTQVVIDEAVQNVTAGQISGDDNQAEFRVNEKISQSQANTEVWKQRLDTALEAADFLEIMRDTAGLVALAAAPIPGGQVVTAIASTTSAITGWSQLAVLSGSALLPAAKTWKLKEEVIEVGRLAFDPSLSAALIEAGQPRAINVPTGVIPEISPEFTAAQQDYNQVLSRLESAIRADRIEDVRELVEDLSNADQNLYRNFLAARAPIQSAILQVGRENPDYPGLDDSVDQISEQTWTYHIARLQLQLKLTLYLIEPTSNHSQEVLAAIDNIRSEVSNYQAVIEQGRDAAGTIETPGTLVVSNTSISPRNPRPGQPFTLTVGIQNVGGATALNVQVEVMPSEPLSLLSSEKLSLGSINQEAERRIEINLMPDKPGESRVVLMVTDNAGQTVMETVSVAIEDYQILLPMIVKGDN